MWCDGTMDWIRWSRLLYRSFSTASWWLYYYQRRALAAQFLRRKLAPRPFLNGCSDACAASILATLSAIALAQFNSNNSLRRIVFQLSVIKVQRKHWRGRFIKASLWEIVFVYCLQNFNKIHRGGLVSLQPFFSEIFCRFFKIFFKFFHCVFQKMVAKSNFKQKNYFWDSFSANTIVVPKKS